MRVVHTSDWHAGRIWKGIDRANELEAVLDDLAEFLQRERVELLLVSGDVFDNGAPVAKAEKLVFAFFKRIGKAGTRSIVIAGNHDSPARIEAWGLLAELVGVYALGSPRPAEHGGVLRLHSCDGDPLNVAVIPFAPSRQLVTAAELAGNETDARQRYADGFATIVERLCRQYRADSINLLMAHTHLQGAVLANSERQVHVGDDWAATPQVLPSNAHYIALGHIHRPQRIDAAAAPAEYAGSPMQLDFGEIGQEKSFVFFDAKPRQPVHPERVPYRGARPLHGVRATLPELERDAARLRELGWLRVEVLLERRIPDLNAVVRRMLPDAVSVQEVLPPPAAVLDVVHASGMSPSEAYRVYFESEHGHPAEDVLVDKFTSLYDEQMRA
jgi:DNA repair protein SbcD/Mre11